MFKVLLKKELETLSCFTYPKHNRFNVSSRKSCDAGNNVVAFVRNWHFCTRKQNVLHQFSVVTLQSLKLSDAKENLLIFNYPNTLSFCKNKNFQVHVILFKHTYTRPFLLLLPSFQDYHPNHPWSLYIHVFWYHHQLVQFLFFNKFYLESC